MAGMFYSLEEVAEKLNITEDQVKQIVQQGKLREFRDGPNLLFKVDEVESLASDADARTQASQTENTPDEMADELEIALTDSSSGSVFESDLTSADTSITSQGINVLGGTESDFEVAQDTSADTAAVDFDAAQAIETDDLSLASSSEEGLLLEHTSLPESQDEQSLSSFGDESLPSLGGQLSSLGDESLSSSGSESPIKDVDDDVNLDSFGSGSGLLDLSLQADDTSLGGILDEIYTPESGQQAEKPLADASSEMNAEADQMLGEEGIEAQVPTEAVSPMAMAAYVEAAPDSLSNAFGYMMFLPLLAIIYTGIVGVAGYMGIRPIILEKIQDIIWYVMAGAAVLAMLIVAVPKMLAGQSGQTEKKKKVAPPKPKKPEKPKKQKKAK